MPSVRFFSEGITVNCAAGDNLRHVALAAGVQLYRSWHVFANCRGKGKCGSCRVELADAGTVEPQQRTEPEHRFLDKKFSDAGTRLACQVCVAGDVVVRTQPRRHRKRVETRSFIPRGF